MASFHDLKTVLTTEPAIEFIKKQMESILSVVDFEYQGEVLNVDGFRLKNLDNWRHEIIEDPSSELIRYIGRMKPCGSRCEFCFLRGNPREVIFNTSYYVTEKEFDTRFRYYFDDREGMLFFQRFNFEEVLNAPLCLSLLKKMREYTDEPFILITGGQLIDDARLEELRLLMPLKLHISINSCRPESRRKIMGHRHTDRLHRILPLVARKGIPFLTSLVAWPSLSLDDILDTIQFCDSCETLYTEVYLPGYTNLNVPGKDFNWQTYYNDICDNIERLRGSVKSGIVVIPSIYDARRRGVTWNECRLTGIVNGSPGHKAGLMPGDMVTGAGSVAFSSRPQAIRILNWAQEKAIPVDLKVRRGINAFTATLSPWLIKEKRSAAYPFGIILPDGFDDGDLKAITEICARRSYKNVLLLISPLMYDSITAAFASQLNGEQSVQVHFKTVESLFFGGNIEAGGLLTVSDYLWAVREFLHTQQAPEAIFLPSGLPAWGRDLCGRTFLELERETGIPLEMVNTSKVVY